MLDLWLNTAPIWLIALLALLVMLTAALAGSVLHKRRLARRGGDEDDSQEGYLVSAVLGLLALLMGFTFALAIDRFDARRLRVLDEANAIGTTYLRAQLMEEPHRSRISSLLVEYTENRIALANALPDENGERLLIENERLITDLWTATSAAFPAIRNLDFSSSFLESMNNLIDLDASRKAARGAHVPAGVLLVLFIYVVVTAVVLGYVLIGHRGRTTASLMLLLLTLSLALIIDIDRPLHGWINESQVPMEKLRDSLRARPPDVFDRWRDMPEGEQ